MKDKFIHVDCNSCPYECTEQCSEGIANYCVADMEKAYRNGYNEATKAHVDMLRKLILMMKNREGTK